jgi:hypothetical protein
VRSLANEPSETLALLGGPADVSDLEATFAGAQPLGVGQAAPDVYDAVAASFAPLAEAGVPDAA